MEPSIRFRIFPCYEEDLNKTVVRIDEKHMQTLGIKSGDTVMLTGGRKTYATCLPLNPAMEPLRSHSSLVFLDETSKNVPIIRLSNLTSSNARLAGTKNTLEVSRAKAVQATKMVLGTIRQQFPYEKESLLLNKLEGMVVGKEDTVYISHSDPNQMTVFQILAADPVADAYIISRDTELEFRDEILPQISEEAKFDILTKVIAVSKQIRNERFVLTFPSLEIYDDASVIHMYIKNKFGNIKERIYSSLRPSIKASDDLGNSYMVTSYGGGTFGGFRYWGPEESFKDWENIFLDSFVLTPALDHNAKELKIVISEMVWHFHEPPPPRPLEKGPEGEEIGYMIEVPETVTILGGPWEFKIPLK